MNHVFADPDLAELDRIWPLGRQLVVPENGTIVVAGAYEGRYMSYLRDLFPTAYLFGYEPQKEKFGILFKRLGNKPRVVLYESGLGTADRQKMPLGNAGTDGANLLLTVDGVVWVNISDAVRQLSLYRGIDVLLLNCEGSEYALIPYLLDEMMHHRIASMAIQFHPKYVSPQRMDRVVAYLEEYYRPAAKECWDFPNWCYYLRR